MKREVVLATFACLGYYINKVDVKLIYNSECLRTPAFQKLVVDILYFIMLCLVEKVGCSECRNVNSSILLTLRHNFFTLSFFEEVMEQHLSLQSNLAWAYFLRLTGRFNCPHVPGDLGMEFPTDPNHSASYKSVSDRVPPGSLHITSHSPHRCNFALRQAVIFYVHVVHANRLFYTHEMNKCKAKA